METEPQNTSKPRRRALKIILITLAALLGGYLLWSACSVWLTPDRRVQQIYLVPRDAALIIQSSDPLGDWKRFTSSPPWQKLAQAESMADIASTVTTLETTLNANRALLGLVGRRELMISLHKTRPDGWDFLALVDLKKISKLRSLRTALEKVMELSGDVTRREYKTVTVIEMRDPVSRDMLHIAFIDNHLAVSYSGALIQAAIDERENPQIGLDPAFVEVEKSVGGRGLCRVYLNYGALPRFLSLFMPSPGGWFDSFTASSDFAGLALEVSKERVEVTGATILGAEPDPYTAALMSSGKAQVRAQSIMPARTAFFATLGFNDPATFVTQLEHALAAGDKTAFDNYRKSRAQLEKYFDISLSDDFLGWMEGEFALAQLEPGLLGREAEYILAVRARDISKARESMALIEQRVRGRTPIRVASVDYNGYPINYVELKGFFRLFFGSLFSRFETPFYTYVDDYVVFSSRSSSLLSFVEDHRQGNSLDGEETFRHAFSRAGGAATVFAYLDTHRFWPLLGPMMSTATWNDMQKNRDIVWSFPSMTMQIVAARQTSLSLAMDYRPYEKPDETTVVQAVGAVTTADDTADASDASDDALDADAESERELMSELKRFHVEQFEGNVLREFYDNGALRSESEVRDGKRHGRYREFSEDGVLLVRGKYTAGRPRGTWKYYTPDGKFDRKERF
ncbi:MAG: DUF3352 domain-containing protein [Alistipes sp.]|jgi:hypothetical protein|nr:DUF3352 domain-containing protein [Alistipes sp.]